MKRFLLILCVACGTLSGLWAQRSISGVVTDAATGDPLIGATVAVKNTNAGTVTAADGTFTLSVPGDDAVVRISYTGYAEQSITIGAQARLDVAMELGTLIDEVVVVGYGRQIRSTLTGNIAKVDGDQLRAMPVVALEQALQGQAAGVYIETANGKVGAASRVRVRGVGSINAGTEPLYVIDGIPIAKEQENTAGGPLNPLADLNFNDIASIEVLKDASAKAIYGSRGSNGVIIITTKTGRAGQSRIELDLQAGTSEPTGRREFLRASEFIDLFTEAANNSDDIEGVAYDDPNSWTDFVMRRFTRYSGRNDSWMERVDRTDWQEEALRQGSVGNSTLAFSGGHDKVRYYASGNYGFTKGILVSNDLEKYGGRLNLDFDATSRLKIGVNFSLSRTLTTQVSDDNAFSTPMQLVAMAPITPTRDEAGQLYDRPVTTYYNGLIDVEDAGRRVFSTRTLTNTFGEYRFNPALVLRVEGAANLLNVRDNAYYGRRTDEGNDSNGAAFAASSNTTAFNTNAVLSWNREFSNHDLGIDLGSEFFSSENVYSYVFGEGFPVDNLKTLSSAANITDADGTTTQYRFLSYFGRARYNFARRYLFNASARVDGSSRFGADNRYAFFPAASAGWVLSEEGFLKDNQTLSFLKFRASWGQSGNADIGNFPALGLFGAGSYNEGSTLQPSQIANPALTWEKSTETNFGLDFGLFKNRISGEIDYYVKNTTDLLLQVPVPATSGFTTQFQNIGELENRGWEFTLNSNNLVGRFSWSTSVNLAINHNEVLSLASGQTLIDDSGSRYANVVKVGAPVGVFYGAEYAGVDPDNGDALWYINDLEVNADLKATTNDYNQAGFVELGSPLPTLIGGISNTLSYAGVTLDIRFQGQQGNKIHNSAGGFMSCNACWFDNQTRDQLDRWQQPGDQTDVPEARLGYSNGDQSRSSRYITDGSYLRLKNVTLAYDVPTSWLRWGGFKTLRVYATGTNLLTFTKYEGWDPEVTTDFLASNTVYGVDFYSAPQPRTIVGGIRFGF